MTKMKKGLVIMAASFCLMLASVPAKAQVTQQVEVSFEEGKSIGKQIQKALDTALEDQTGEVLYEISMPEGTYELDTLLKVYSYTTIKMNGCMLMRGADKSMVRLGQEEETYSGYEGYHDIRIEGGTFNGNGKDGKCDVSMIRLGHGSNIVFQDMVFENVYEGHHVELAGCENVSFLQCTFRDFYGKGDTSNTANNEALQFDVLHNKVHFPKYPGFDDTPCRNITVDSCVFYNLQRGLGTHSAVAGSYFTNIQFTNNTFHDIKGYAMIATNFKDSVIRDNKIDRCGAGILFRSMVQGHNNFYTPLSGGVSIDNNASSVIENNQIQVSDYKYKTTAYGISLYGEKLTAKKKDVPKGDYTLKGVKVKNNTITMNNSGYGIWLQGANECEISGNSVTMDVKASASGGGNSDCIRLVKSAKNKLNKNKLTQKKKNKKTQDACGIVVTTNSSATIEKNQIKNSPKDGIFVVTSSKATVTGNTIKKTGRYGLNVCVKSTVTSKKNKMTKCGKRPTNVYDRSRIKTK